MEIFVRCRRTYVFNNTGCQRRNLDLRYCFSDLSNKMSGGGTNPSLADVLDGRAEPLVGKDGTPPSDSKSGQGKIAHRYYHYIYVLYIV